jgi:predicted TIM-barrel fold metal-dependent hydrolase
MSVVDAHLHIVDPRFPLTPNQGYVPDPFSSADYLRAAAGVDLAGGAVVAGSFQGFDPRGIAAAVAELGTAFVGVAQLLPNVADEVCGTDLPSARARRPYSPADLQLVLDTFDETAANRVLCGNAAGFYRVTPPVYSA